MAATAIERLARAPQFCAHCAVGFVRTRALDDQPVTVDGLPWHRGCAWRVLLETLDDVTDPDRRRLHGRRGEGE